MSGTEMHNLDADVEDPKKSTLEGDRKAAFSPSNILPPAWRQSWKFWNPLLPSKLGVVAKVFNDRDQHHRRWFVASVPCLILLVIVIAASAHHVINTAGAGGAASASQQALINTLGASGTVSGSSIHVQQLNPAASTMVTASGLTGGGNLQFSSSVATPNVAQEFTGYGAASVAAPQGAPTASIPTLESKYTVMVYKGTTSVYGLTNVAYTATFLMPKGSTNAADAKMILKISATSATGSFGSVIPDLGHLLPSDAWTSQLKFSGTILLASHTISTQEVSVIAGLNLHSEISATGLQSIVGAKLAAKFPTLKLNVFAPVAVLEAGAKLPSLSGATASSATAAALANANLVTASISMGDYVAGSVPMSGMRLVVNGVGNNPIVKLDAGVDMNLPYGGHFFAPLEASFSKTAGFQMNAAIQTFSLGSTVDKYLSFSNMKMSGAVTPTPQLWDVNNLAFSATGVIKATNPITVTVTGAASYSQAQKASLYFDAAITTKVQPATLMCDMGISFACGQSVKDLATKLGLNAQVNANLVVAYGDATVNGKLVAAGVSLKATVTPNWSNLVALGPLNKFYDFQAATAEVGLTADVFTTGAIKAGIFVKNAKLKDTAWTGKIAFPSFGAFMTTAPVQLGVVAQMTYAVSSTEVLAFQFQVAMAATPALTFSANMNSMWTNAFGINALNIANVGMTVTFDAATTSVSSVGMAGDVVIAGNSFKSMFYVSATGPPAMSGTMDKLQLKDLYNWALNVSGMSASTTFAQLPAPVQSFMNSVHVNQAAFKYAATSTTIGNQVFKPGFNMAFASVIYGATLDASVVVKDVTLGGNQVQDVVLGYVVKGLTELTNLASTLVAPVKQMIIDYLNNFVGTGWMITQLETFDYNALLSVQQIAVDNFGLVSSTAGGAGAAPSVAANVTIGGTSYTWAATMPVSALTGDAAAFFTQAATTFAASVVTNIVSFQIAVLSSFCPTLEGNILLYGTILAAFKGLGICP